MPAMDSTNPRDQLVKLLKEFPAIYNDFSMLLIPVIAAKHKNDSAESLFTKQYQLMMTLLVTIVLFFSSLVIGTILKLHNSKLLPLVTYTMIMLGAAASVVALSLISPAIAWIAFALWVGILTLIAYFNRQKLHDLICPVVSDVIKNWFASGNTQSPESMTQIP